MPSNRHPLSSRAPLLALLLILAACAARPARDMPGPEATTPRRPQTYTGVLPCADCPGIDQVLTLFPGGSYRLRLSYRERPAVFHELGRWYFDADGARLHLNQASRSTDYQVLPTGLRRLDAQGRPIASPFDYVLSLREPVDPIAEPMPLRGLFTWDGEAAWLLECESGERFAVRDDESDAFVALVRRYRRAADLGKPVLVRVSGRFEARGNSAQAIRLERVQELIPVQSCAAGPKLGKPEPARSSH